MKRIGFLISMIVIMLMVTPVYAEDMEVDIDIIAEEVEVGIDIEADSSEVYINGQSVTEPTIVERGSDGVGTGYVTRKLENALTPIYEYMEIMNFRQGISADGLAKLIFENSEQEAELIGLWERQKLLKDNGHLVEQLQGDLAIYKEENRNNTEAVMLMEYRLEILEGQAYDLAVKEWERDMMIMTMLDMFVASFVVACIFYFTRMVIKRRKN